MGATDDAGCIMISYGITFIFGVLIGFGAGWIAGRDIEIPGTDPHDHHGGRG